MTTHQRGPWARRTLAIGCLGVFAVAVLAVPAGAQRGCEQDGKNMQCNEFGTISMDTQREIRGEPIEVTVDAMVLDNHMEQGARYIMFSVRHDNAGHASPVSLELKKLSTRHGAIFTDRVDHDIPNEINVWAHVADVPENTPIQLVVGVGASDRGAFRLETLVMPFDRGYEGLRDRSGEEVTMFSFTMLGVNEETGDVGGGDRSFVDKLRTPGFTGGAGLAALVVVAALVLRRRPA